MLEVEDRCGADVCPESGGFRRGVACRSPLKPCWPREWECMTMCFVVFCETSLLLIVVPHVAFADDFSSSHVEAACIQREIAVGDFPTVDVADAHDVQVKVTDVVHVHAYESGHIGVDADDAVDDGDEASVWSCW